MDVKKQDEKHDKHVKQALGKNANFGCGYLFTSVLGSVAIAIYWSDSWDSFTEGLIFYMGFSLMAFVWVSVHIHIKRWGNIGNFVAGMISWVIFIGFLVLVVTIQ